MLQLDFVPLWTCKLTSSVALLPADLCTSLQMCCLLLKSPYLCVGVCSDFPRCGDPNCNHANYSHLLGYLRQENLGQGALLFECDVDVKPGALRLVAFSSNRHPVSSYVDETNAQLIWILRGDLFLNQES